MMAKSVVEKCSETEKLFYVIYKMYLSDNNKTLVWFIGQDMKKNIF